VKVQAEEIVNVAVDSHDNWGKNLAAQISETTMGYSRLFTILSNPKIITG